MKKLVYFGGGGSGGFTWTVIELLSENVVLFIKWAGPDPLWAAVGVLLRRIRRRRKRNGNRNLNGIGVGAGKLCESLRLRSFGAGIGFGIGIGIGIGKNGELNEKKSA